jgi:hypothetical protein
MRLSEGGWIRSWWVTLIGLIVTGMLIAVPRVWAFESRGGDSVVIAADEVIEDDLYAGAG